MDDYYTPGGNVTNGFDIQTPSAIHTNTVALSSDYTMTDGTVFTGEKGVWPVQAHWHTTRVQAQAHPSQCVGFFFASSIFSQSFTRATCISVEVVLL